MTILNSYKKTFHSIIGSRLYKKPDLTTVQVASPINGETLYEITEANTDCIKEACEIAGKSQKKWASFSCDSRADILDKISDIIIKNKILLAESEMLDIGKSLSQALNEVQLGAEYFRYFAACIRTQEGSASHVKDVLSINLNEPIGKIAIILPWNFPILMFSWKLAPALAAGNSVIVKPSEYASLSIIKLVEIITPIIPKGIINIILGSGSTAGKKLIQEATFDKIFFTGGRHTAKIISSALSKRLIPASFELGGKSPCIITADCFKHSTQFRNKILKNVLLFTHNQGQICGNLSRLIIEESIADTFLDQLKDSLEKYTVGDPRNKKNNMGPVISEAHKNKILEHINQARQSGAKITAFPNTIHLTETNKNGFYISPYLVEGNQNISIYQLEIFGPVLCISTFKTLNEAVYLANSTPYGLTASIWSRDIEAINYLTKNIDAGKIWINASHIYYPHTKFGGFKESGSGNEMHKLALNDFQRIKNIIQHY